MIPTHCRTVISIKEGGGKKHGGASGFSRSFKVSFLFFFFFKEHQSFEVKRAQC